MKVLVKEVGRNKEYVGFFKSEPTVGKNFYVLAEDMYDDENYLTTVEVVSVEQTLYGWKFKTQAGQEYEVYARKDAQQLQQKNKIGRA